MAKKQNKNKVAKNNGKDYVYLNEYYDMAMMVLESGYKLPEEESPVTHCIPTTTGKAIDRVDGLFARVADTICTNKYKLPDANWEVFSGYNRLNTCCMDGKPTDGTAAMYVPEKNLIFVFVDIVDKMEDKEISSILAHETCHALLYSKATPKEEYPMIEGLVEVVRELLYPQGEANLFYLPLNFGVKLMLIREGHEAILEATKNGELLGIFDRGTKKGTGKKLSVALPALLKGNMPAYKAYIDVLTHYCRSIRDDKRVKMVLNSLVMEPRILQDAAAFQYFNKVIMA